MALAGLVAYLAMSGAVFLSYASQDAEAARRICEALRAGGVEVWFDQEGGLEHGDAWDAKIRGQIKDCVLFIPLISANTQARPEGYFRIEWDLAAERAQGIAQGVPFILPVVIDGTREPDALVPDRFRKVQWTRLPGGVVPPEVRARLLKLWSHRIGAPAPGAATVAKPSIFSGEPASRRPAPVLTLVVAALVCIGLALAWWALGSRTSQTTRSTTGGEPQGTAPSEARQLAEKARAMSVYKYDSGSDDFAAAEGLIKRALELDPNDPEVLSISSLLNSYFAVRNFDHSPARSEQARSQAERALKLDPDSLDGLVALGEWQYVGEPDNSVTEKTLKSVLDRAPDQPVSLFALGCLYQREGRVEEAKVALERLAMQPDFAALARYEEFLMFFYRARFTEAERCLRESIATKPYFISVAELALLLVTAQGDLRGAMAALGDMPVAGRDEPRTIWVSTYVRLLAREPDEALTVLSRFPSDFMVDVYFTGPKAYLVGLAYLEAGRSEAARIEFESALSTLDEKLKTVPGDRNLHLIRGETLAWLGRKDEALREAEVVKELRVPFIHSIGYWRSSPAQIYAALGLSDDALPLLKEQMAAVDHEAIWPLTPALLKLDPLWDKLRGDPRFQALENGGAESETK